MNYPPIFNPAPFVLAASLAGLMAIPATDATTQPDPGYGDGKASFKELTPVLVVLAATATLILLTALRGHGIGTTGPLVILGLATAALVAYATNPALMGGAA